VPAAGGAGAAGDLQLGERRYRGQLQILASGSGLRAINHLPLEQYLASVVGSEMPASWPQAALRAQAVAARTYVLRQRKPGALFDVTATTASQVYRGVEAETASTREAVAATRAQVLLFEGSLVEAVFHSSSGGVSTENSGEIWNQQLPYLVSVPDLDDVSPVQNWRQTLAPELLRKAFGEIGGALSIEVLSTSASGRIRQARVTGPAGTLLLSGTQLRSRLGLRSTLVHFEFLTPDPATQPAWAMPPASANLLPGNKNGARVPLAGGSAQNSSGAINYGSIATGSATSGSLASGSLASGAISPASTSALAIFPTKASAGATIVAAGNGSSGGTYQSNTSQVPASQAAIAAGGYVPGMPASASLAQLPPPPLLPAIQPASLQLTQPTLLAIGRGFGHGVGMSQWGAYGLARRGEDYQRILLHYYRGSELRPYAAALVSP
jgi:stage II sporulation protein D